MTQVSGKKETVLIELWKTIPFEMQLQIDMAVCKGNMAEAANHCKCSVKNIDFLTAIKLVELRRNELRKMI